MSGWSSKLRRNPGRRGDSVHAAGSWGPDKVKEETSGSWGHCGDEREETSTVLTICLGLFVSQGWGLRD